MNTITLYHKDYCPYCKSAKALLDMLGWRYTEIEVTDDVRAFSEMVSRSGRRTVPQIFIEDQHIGGFDDFVEYLESQGLLEARAS